VIVSTCHTVSAMLILKQLVSYVLEFLFTVHRSGSRKVQGVIRYSRPTDTCSKLIAEPQCGKCGAVMMTRKVDSGISSRAYGALPLFCGSLSKFVPARYNSSSRKYLGADFSSYYISAVGRTSRKYRMRSQAGMPRRWLKAVNVPCG